MSIKIYIFNFEKQQTNNNNKKNKKSKRNQRRKNNIYGKLIKNKKCAAQAKIFLSPAFLALAELEKLSSSEKSSSLEHTSHYHEYNSTEMEISVQDSNC